MRHSYASHWLKSFEDKGWLLGYMGHATDDMLIDNYLRAVDRKTAACYWEIGPPAPFGNVVSITARVRNARVVGLVTSTSGKYLQYDTQTTPSVTDCEWIVSSAP